VTPKTPSVGLGFHALRLFQVSEISAIGGKVFWDLGKRDPGRSFGCAKERRFARSCPTTLRNQLKHNALSD
jgi:hypothetical protein